MSASGAFSWGVSTSGDASQIPSINNVYQWYGFVDDGLRLHLSVLYREFNPESSDGRAAGPIFEQSQFTVEAAIRRCLRVAAQVNLEKLAALKNKRLKSLFERLIQESRHTNSANFRDLFRHITEESSSETSGGLALFEPFSSEQQDPPLTIEGNQFPNQGVRGAKRFRLMTSTDDGQMVPVRMIPSGGERSAGIRLEQGGRPWASPWGDMRLLAGSLVVGNPKLYYLMLQFVNQLMTPVRFTTFTDANVGVQFQRSDGAVLVEPDPTVTEGLFIPKNHATAAVAGSDTIPMSNNAIREEFPTILNYRDVRDIHTSIVKNFGNRDLSPMAFMTMYGDQVVRKMNELIQERMAAKTTNDIIQPVKNIFEFDRRVFAEIATRTRPDHATYDHHVLSVLNRERQHGLGAGFNFPGNGAPARVGTYTTAESETHRERYQAMRNEINKLRTNPILWINGPRLSQHQGVETLSTNNYERVLITDPKGDPDVEKYRPNILPGFVSETLKSYCHDAGKGISDAYAITPNPIHQVKGQIAKHLFSTDSTLNSGLHDPKTLIADERLGDDGFYMDRDYNAVPVGTNTDPYRRSMGDGRPKRHGLRQFYNNYGDPLSNTMDSLNTIYNIIMTPGVAVRLSDWQEALGMQEEVDILPAEGDNMEDTMHLTEPPFFTRIEQPDNEQRFRLSLMDPPRIGDAEIDKEDLDYDQVFKQFEYDSVIGDHATYINEILTVIRLALGCIVIDTSDAGYTKEDISLFDLYKKEDANKLYDHVIPVLPLLSVGKNVEVSGTNHTVGGWMDSVTKNLKIQRTGTQTATPMPLLFKYDPGAFKMSACSQFVYNNIINHATAPFTEAGRRSVPVKNIIALISSLNPFPVSNEYSRAFITEVLNLCAAQLKERFGFGHGFHLVQHLEHTRPEDMKQVMPIIKFKRTTLNGDKLSWMVGTESTWMLEGMVLAVNLINVLSAKQNSQPVDNLEDVSTDIIPPMEFNMKQNEVGSKAEAIQRVNLQRTKKYATRDIKENDKTINAIPYAEWLLIEGSNYNQCGRYFFGGKPPIETRGPVGVFTNRSAYPVMFDGLHISDIETTVPPPAMTTYFNRAQLAIDAASTEHMWGLKPVNNGGGAAGVGTPFDLVDNAKKIYTNANDPYATANTMYNINNDNFMKQLAVFGYVVATLYRIETTGQVTLSAGNDYPPLLNSVGTQAPVYIVGVFPLVNGVAIEFDDEDVTGPIAGLFDPSGDSYKGMYEDITRQIIENQLTHVDTREVFKRVVRIAVESMCKHWQLKTKNQPNPGPVVMNGGNFVRDVAGFSTNMIPFSGYNVQNINAEWVTTKSTNDYEAQDAENYIDAMFHQFSKMLAGVYHFDTKVDEIIQIMGTPDHYYRGQRLCLPLWETNDESAMIKPPNLMGYILFSKATVWVEDDGDLKKIRFNFYETTIDKVTVYDPDAIHHVGSQGGEEIYAMRKPAVIAIPADPTDIGNSGFTELITFKRNVPMWYAATDASTVVEQTADIRLDLTEGNLPYKYTVRQNPEPKVTFKDTQNRTDDNYDASDLTVEKITDVLMENFDGLHFSNSRSERRTILAVATGANADIVRAHVTKQLNNVYKTPISWACHMDDGTGDAILLKTLYEVYEGSTTRATEASLAQRVMVYVQGPGENDLATPCYVEGYYYRTSEFFRVEPRAMTLFKEIVGQTYSTPTNAVRAPIALRLGRCFSIHDILVYRKEAAAAMVELMILLYKSSGVAIHTTQGRNRAALLTQNSLIATSAKTILYYI